MDVWIPVDHNEYGVKMMTSEETILLFACDTLVLSEKQWMNEII
jgi:hypothetical protein